MEQRGRKWRSPDAISLDAHDYKCHLCSVQRGKAVGTLQRNNPWIISQSVDLRRTRKGSSVLAVLSESGYPRNPPRTSVATRMEFSRPGCLQPAQEFNGLDFCHDVPCITDEILSSVMGDPVPFSCSRAYRWRQIKTSPPES